MWKGRLLWPSTVLFKNTATKAGEQIILRRIRRGNAVAMLQHFRSTVTMFQALAVPTSNLAQPSTAWVFNVPSKRFSQVMLTG